MSYAALKISRFVPSFRRLAAGKGPVCSALTKHRPTVYGNFQGTIYTRNQSCLSLPARTELVNNAINVCNVQISQRCVFHTTPRREIPPVVVLLLKPIAKLASIITGRNFRKWWQSLTPDKKQHYKDQVFKRKSVIAAALGLIGVGIAVHYVTHLQTTPVTNRRRYVALNNEQFIKIAKFEYDMLIEGVKDSVVPATHPVYERVVNVTQRIIAGNQDLELFKNMKWTIIVVSTDEANAYVLPTGHIFVNTGLLQVTENDDQLAVVLGHELAHVLLSHGAEQLSFAAAMDVIIIVMLGAIWAIMPTDGLAIVTEWFYNKVMQLMLHLPYSRKLELEADEVGLQLIAKACFDIRESTVFWSAMTVRNELKDQVEVPQFISTHPANDVRAEKLDQLMPEAMKQRESCNCPTLSIKDPRAKIAALAELVKEKNQAKEKNQSAEKSR